jgi:hypothetical protein
MVNWKPSLLESNLRFLHVPNQEIVREKMIFRRLLIFFPLDRIVLYDVLEIIQNILF